MSSTLSLWHQCLQCLEDKLTPTDYHTWIFPLQAEMVEDGLCLFAPNRFICGYVEDNYLTMIKAFVQQFAPANTPHVLLKMGRKSTAPNSAPSAATVAVSSTPAPAPTRSVMSGPVYSGATNLNKEFTFDTFVEGKSNQLGRAASIQVAENPGTVYNPLFIYGGVGLGKTHLMHAIGNLILERNPQAKVLYIHSERFVADMVKALQNNQISEFKDFYRSRNVLMLDDIQFFAGKERSQDELFHTLNALLEGQQQLIIASDRYPKEITGLEERLKSRFGWGLTVAIEPPELETRVAILMSKSQSLGIALEYDVAFFIAKRVRANVRELEGALKRVMANAKFTGKEITIEFVKESLKDLLALQDKLVTIDNIQRTVAEYFSIKVADLLSKRRSRSVARPRQLAMALAKELTNHSLPEVGDAFGGRDHTTVLHACRTIKAMLDTDTQIQEDWTDLVRILSS